MGEWRGEGGREEGGRGGGGGGGGADVELDMCLCPYIPAACI